MQCVLLKTASGATGNESDEGAWSAQSYKSNATSENETVNRDLYEKLINTNLLIGSLYQKVILLF